MLLIIGYSFPKRVIYQCTASLGTIFLYFSLVGLINCPWIKISNSKYDRAIIQTSVEAWTFFFLYLLCFGCQGQTRWLTFFLDNNQMIYERVSFWKSLIHKLIYIYTWDTLAWIAEHHTNVYFLFYFELQILSSKKLPYDQMK